ncbi:hypothetical protein VNO77_18484 [Canavalia gladiata]|uniref:Transmembrane protein n=1 Tax=Canavalia gladiata TaxID=3824 RepID=A0AAN9QJP4_CANGL
MIDEPLISAMQSNKDGFKVIRSLLLMLWLVKLVFFIFNGIDMKKNNAVVLGIYFSDKDFKCLVDEVPDDSDDDIDTVSENRRDDDGYKFEVHCWPHRVIVNVGIQSCTCRFWELIEVLVVGLGEIPPTGSGQMWYFMRCRLNGTKTETETS